MKEGVLRDGSIPPRAVWSAKDQALKRTCLRYEVWDSSFVGCSQIAQPNQRPPLF